MAAFLKAQDLPIGGIELDVQFTNDEQIVVFHDDAIDDVLLSDCTISDLQSFTLSNGEKIPLLSQFIQNWKGLHSLWIELKEAQLSEGQKERFVDAVLREVNRCEKGIYFISFDFSLLKMLASKTNHPCLYLNDDCLPKKLFDKGIKGMDIEVNRLDTEPTLIFQLKRLKMLINAWTVNDVRIGEELLIAGVDFITTDELEMFLSDY